MSSQSVPPGGLAGRGGHGADLPRHPQRAPAAAVTLRRQRRL